MATNPKVVVVTGAMVLLLGGICGYLVRYVIEPEDIEHEEDTSFKAKLMEEISSHNIQENLRFLTKRPHIGGRDGDEVRLVDFIKKKMEDSGLDPVVSHSYEVLLSYPKQKDSNYIALLDQDGVESAISQRKELVIDSEQNDPDVVDPFNAYSAAGDPKGDLIYVNYGRIQDFLFLNRTLQINIMGKICISRYGKIFRGSKAIHAEQFGCEGLILYSDPEDYTVPWAGVYPDDWFLPPTGAQRGTLQLDGDPLTPNYPAIYSAWRKPLGKLSLPKIPVTPIGYGDALKYLGKLRGDEVQESWKGGLNITYRYGPGFSHPYNASQIKMHVMTHHKEVVTNNIIGYIKGSYEPDRYVIIGNHRDAWVFGAIDPSSGTSVMLEIIRAFGIMVKQGWRPRRTLMFCSWGAEEYGLIGSTEWVEHFQKILQARTVAYLNVDISVRGNHTIRVKGVPSLRDLVYDVTKQVTNPNAMEADELHSVYDSWKAKTPNGDNLPYYQSLDSGSDYAPFQHSFGIPSVDFSYDFDTSLRVKSYPIYHSVYETFEYVKKFVDPEFAFHRAIGQVWAEVGRELVDSVFLPIDCRLYAEDLATKRDAFTKEFGTEMHNHGIRLGDLYEAITTFSNAAKDFHTRLNSIDLSNVMEVRMANDQLMQLERAFLDYFTLPGRISHRHVISAPDVHNGYGATAFPGLSDSLFDIGADQDQEERWEEVKRQKSIVVFHIIAAADTLRPAIVDTAH